MVTLVSADFGKGRRRLAAASGEERPNEDSARMRAARSEGGRGDNGDSTRRPALSPLALPSPRPTRGGRRRMRRARHTRKSALRQPAQAPKPKPSNQPKPCQLATQALRSKVQTIGANCPRRPNRVVLRMVWQPARTKKMIEVRAVERLRAFTTDKC